MVYLQRDKAGLPAILFVADNPFGVGNWNPTIGGMNCYNKDNHSHRNCYKEEHIYIGNGSCLQIMINLANIRWQSCHNTCKNN